MPLPSRLCPTCNDLPDVMARASEMARGLSDLMFHVANNELPLPESQDLLLSFSSQLEFIGHACQEARHALSGAMPLSGHGGDDREDAPPPHGIDDCGSCSMS